LDCVIGKYQGGENLPVFRQGHSVPHWNVIPEEFSTSLVADSDQELPIDVVRGPDQGQGPDFYF
jgi:hypothetical protein